MCDAVYYSRIYSPLLQDAGVGKTCLVLRFVSNVFNVNSESTVG